MRKNLSNSSLPVQNIIVHYYFSCHFPRTVFHGQLTRAWWSSDTKAVEDEYTLLALTLFVNLGFSLAVPRFTQHAVWLKIRFFKSWHHRDVVRSDFQIHVSNIKY
ncbi:hypothetical protein VPH35_063232 [Triticum aestivum]